MPPRPCPNCVLRQIGRGCSSPSSLGWYPTLARRNRTVAPSSPMLGTCTCPLLEVRPSRGLVDEKFQIAIENLPPAHKVTLHSLHQSEDGDFWEAFGFYVSDADGRVMADRDESLGGTYEGVEPMGLLWSLRPVPGSRTGLRLRKKHVASPMVVCISVYEGHVSQRFRELVALAYAITERWYMGPGVHRVDVREGGVSGTLFLPQGPGPFPGVLDMWGGGGGLVEYRAALLASHGFVTMALDYLPADKSRTADIEIGYFDAAFKLVQGHPLVARNSVAVLGLSFGTSVALSMAAYSTVAKPRCCVCISGSHVHPINKPIHSVFEEIQANLLKTRFDENSYLVWRDVILPLPSEPGLKVDVGRIRCPLLVIVGQDDQNWATVESAEDMQKMMEEAGNSHLLTILSYPGAGHLIEPPYSPHVRASNFFLRGDKVIMLWGGETKPHADAQEDSWKKILEFLQLHLYHTQGSAPLSRL